MAYLQGGHTYMFEWFSCTFAGILKHPIFHSQGETAPAPLGEADVPLKTCGRPWPHEWEGPASVAQWEGWSEAEGFKWNIPEPTKERGR